MHRKISEDTEDTEETEASILRYSSMVYRLAFARTGSKADADDIYQEVFLRFIQADGKFESEEHKKAWLIRVTINCTKKLWASAWFRHTEGLNDEIVFETREDIGLWQELGRLPQKYRTVIHLFYYEELSIEQISAILRQKPSTVRTQLTRARYLLRDILKEEYNV